MASSNKVGAPMVGATVDTSLIDAVSSTGVEDVREQLQEIANRYGISLRRIVALPGAMPGRGYRPVSGYIAVFDSNAVIQDGVFDMNALFYGRSIVPLIENTQDMIIALSKVSLDSSGLLRAIRTKFSNAAMLELVDGAIEMALSIVNDDLKKREISWELELTEAPQMRPMFTILESVSGYELPLLAFEAHLREKTRGATTMERLLHSAIKAKSTLKELFMQNSDVSEYCKAQMRMRALTLQIIRARIISAIAGDEGLAAAGLQTMSVDMASSDLITHQTINIVHLNANNELVYYNGAIKASLIRGGLISGGPFNIWLWTNRNNQALAKLQMANIESAVPFCMAKRMDRSQMLEKLVRSIALHEDYANQIPIKDTDNEHIAMAEEPVSLLRTEINMVDKFDSAVLIFPKNVYKVDIVLPELSRNYMESLAQASTWTQLNQMGIESNTSYTLLRPVLSVITTYNALDCYDLWNIYAGIAKSELDGGSK